MFLTSYIFYFFFKDKTTNNLLNLKTVFFLNFKLKYKLLKFFKSQNIKHLNNVFFSFYEIFLNNFYFNILIFIFSLKKIDFLNFLFFKNNFISYFSNFTNTNKTLNSLENNFSNLSYFKFNKIKFLKKFQYFDFKNFFKINYLIKFSISDFFKYLNNTTLQSINILFLRKNKVFNKGRYSRNRQYYRTGVYWCLYVNIVAVVGLYFWFYRFNMNFGYLWWILYLFIFSLFFSRSYSLNVFGLKQTFVQIFSSFYWFTILINNFFFSIINFFFQFFKNFK